MNRYGGCLFAFCAILAAWSVNGSAQSTASTLRKTIQARYDAMDSGVISLVANKELSKYKAGVKEYTTTDFRWISSDGKQTADQKGIVDYWTAFLSRARSVDRAKTSLQKFTVDDATAATVIAETHQDYTLLDPQGKTHQLKTITISRDRWTKTPAGWKVKTMQALRGEQWLDGKAFTGDALTYVTKEAKGVK